MLRVVLLAISLAGCSGAVMEEATPAAPEGAPPPPVANEPTPPPPSPGPPPPREPTRIGDVISLEIEAADASALRGHVYVPNAAGPFAVVLAFGPYWGNEFPATDRMDAGDGRLRDIYGDDTYALLLEAGFAVAFFNVRGTGESGGCYRHFDPQDGSDAAILVEALAAQPWSTGAVGMYGTSYDGWTQYAAMAARPPHLRATAPISGIIDPWSVSTRHGAMVRNYVAAGLAYTGAVALDAGSLVSGAGDASGPSPRSDHACIEGAQDTLDSDAVVLQGDRTPALAVRDLRAAVRASGVPAFATYGLAQPALDGTGRISPFEGLVMNAQDLSSILPEGSRILVGPWPHGPPPYETFSADVVEWFEAKLLDGVLPPRTTVRYQDDAGVWHDADAWPPPVVTATVAVGSGRLTSTDRPPTLEACGPDQAVYTWPPTDAHLAFAGAFTLEVDVLSTAPDGNLVAWLFATEGQAACGTDARAIARAHTDLRHRGTLDVGTPFPVGTPTTVALRSAPFAASLPPGSGLALVVAGGDALILLPKAAKPTLVLGEGTLTLPVAAR